MIRPDLQIENIPFKEFEDNSLMSDQDHEFEQYMEQLGSKF